MSQLIHGRTAVDDYRRLVALDRIPGVTGIRKFGHNSDVGTSFEDLWDGNTIYPFPTVAAPVRIAAGGDAADTAGGLGARSVQIEGIDDSWNVAIETLATNGALVSADTSTNFIRVYRATVVDSGAYGAENTAAISIESNPGGVELAIIPIGIGQTQMAIYTVPDGKVALLCQYEITVDITGAQTFDVQVWKRENADTVAAPFTAPRLIGELDGIGDRANRGFCVYPESIPARSDIWMSAKASAGAGRLSAEFDLWLVDVGG